MNTRMLSTGQKSLVQLLGLLLFLGGLPVGLGTACAALLSATSTNAQSIVQIVALLTLTALSLGAGSVLFMQSTRSIGGRPSGKMRMPSLLRLGGLFVILLLAGMFFGALRIVPAWFVPPILTAAASLPPLFAVAWFMRDKPGRLTWRRGSVAFVLGATLAITLAFILEIVLPGIVLLFISPITTAVGRYLQSFLDALGGGQVGTALTSPGFIVLFVQLAIIAPFVEELCKPLATLPILRYLGRRDAFLVGAFAGAGFAAVENVIYLVSGFAIWPGILIVRAIGAAIHPLGAGLVASGWHGVLRAERGARLAWLVRYSAAVAMHALWNGGTLLIITLAGVPFFGRTPELAVFGVSAPGLALAFLLLVGLAALWTGGDAANDQAWAAAGMGDAGLAAKSTGMAHWSFDYNLSDRAIAIWAVACIAVVLPVGMVALTMMNR